LARSWRETCELNATTRTPPTLFNPDKLPAFHDPFAGGGALPLEAQRLGLESYASDLNPVAVTINKAMIEIPPKFAGRAPVGPPLEADKGTARKGTRDAFEDWSRRTRAGRRRAPLRCLDAQRGAKTHRPPLSQIQSYS
jgi:putative DNA methylase